jgi:Tfp pilus tip-associated adhesin PilY1
MRSAFRGQILLVPILLMIFSFSTTASACITCYAGYKFTKEEFRDGYWYQVGTHTWDSGHEYVGEFINHVMNGKGTITYTWGDKYEGEWKDGTFYKGIYTWKNGSKYVGEYKGWTRHGKGTLTWADGRKYVGEFKDNKRHGKGEDADCKSKSNPEKYVGEFRGDTLWNGKAYDCQDGRVVAVYSKGARRRPFHQPPPNDAGVILLPTIVQSHYLGEVSEERPLSEITKEVVKLREQKKYKHYPSVPTAARAGSHVAFSYDSKGQPSRVYVASSHPDKLSGDLWALSINSDGDIHSTPLWKAQSELSGVVPDKRVMLTWNGRSRQGVPFRWTDLPWAQREDLKIARWKYFNDPIKASFKTELIDGTCPSDIVVANTDSPNKPSKITFTCGVRKGAGSWADLWTDSGKLLRKLRVVDPHIPDWAAAVIYTTPTYQYWSYTDAGRCRVAMATAGYDCRIYMPTWQQTFPVHSFGANGWGADMRRLISHEVGHCVYFQELVPRVIKALEGMTADSCGALDAAVKKKFAPLRSAAYTATSKFDKLTYDLKGNHFEDTWWATDEIARARLMYIRGEKKHEGPRDWKNLRLHTEELNYTDRLSHYKFQKRDAAGPLGEFGHSAPVVVGEPYLGHSADYVSFKDRVKTRPTVVYAGSNDGLLHGFDADTGKELLAYLPASLNGTGLTGGWHSLTDPNQSRNAYVDGTPAVFDVKLSSGRKGWRTLLFGSLNRGGRGIFALDVTNPAGFSEKNAKEIVLWEFMGCHKQGCTTSQGAVHNADDPHMGYSYSQPVAAQMNNGEAMVIFGNGDTLDNAYSDKDSGKAQLFIASIAGGIDGSWALNKNYWRIPVGTVDATRNNGLSSVTVGDVDGNGIADRIYAGDLYGNLWVFDVSSSNPNDWGIAPEFKGKPLFTTGESQPITTSLSVIRHPTIEDPSNTNLMVLFGTGTYREESEKVQSSKQAFYGVWDRGRGALQRQHLVSQKFLLNNNKARVTDPHLKVDYASKRAGGAGGHYGWYIDLPAEQERVIYRSLVLGDLVYFNTLIPRKHSNLSGGWEMVVKTLNGGSPDDAAFDINGDQLLTSKDAFHGVNAGQQKGVGFAGRKLGPDRFNPGAPAHAGDTRVTAVTERYGSIRLEVTKTKKPDKKISRGRMSWEELHPRFEHRPSEPLPTELQAPAQRNSVELRRAK